ncbi:hypothetical protein [Streptomyces xinghaiensis]|uniref:hypothetical protein n=1 Tax=Streptomyces xinghaiensis TaxID=1038928 RepID=UPI001FEFE3CD|nr:hypothetical protein [Streptomyces xinghaiensis]
MLISLFARRPAAPGLTGVRARTTLLLAAVVPLAAATAAAVLKASHLELYADRHRIRLTPVARRSCPRCHGDGGWWVTGANPEMEACGCWSNRRELCIRLLPIPPWPDEPPF